jgi:glycosyltransferase involved in cell wall biosynthesis
MMRADLCFAFLGNPHTDSRITNIYESLKKCGKSVKVFGFDWYGGDYNSPPDWEIMKIARRPSLFFYIKSTLKLFLRLIDCKSEIYIAEDVYTLPVVAIIAKGRKKKLYYNSREFYTSIGGLAGKSSVQKFIAAIEKFFIKYVDVVTVTGEMDKEFIENLYHPKEIIVIRNIPKKVSAKTDEIVNLKKRLNIPDNKIILIYQGMLQKGRGIYQSIEAVAKVNNAVLVLIGYGPDDEKIRNLIEKKNLQNKVFLTGAIEHKELLNYTAGADIGLTLIENISTSYYYALPNKLFEYLNAGLCVISSPLPQMEKIVKEYKVGEVVETEDIDKIAETINKIAGNSELLEKYKRNALTAKNELNWENEFEKVKNYFC